MRLVLRCVAVGEGLAAAVLVAFFVVVGALLAVPTVGSAVWSGLSPDTPRVVAVTVTVGAVVLFPAAAGLASAQLWQLRRQGVATSVIALTLAVIALVARGDTPPLWYAPPVALIALLLSPWSFRACGEKATVAASGRTRRPWTRGGWGILISAMCVDAAIVVVLFALGARKNAMWESAAHPGMRISDVLLHMPDSSAFELSGPACRLSFMCWGHDDSCLIMAEPRWDRELVSHASVRGTWALTRPAFAQMLDQHADDLAGCGSLRISWQGGRFYREVLLARGAVASVGPRIKRWD